MYISSVAGLIAAALSTVGTKLVGVSEITLGQVAVNSVFQMVSGIVLGNITGFILMQGMKTNKPADEFIEVNQKLTRRLFNVSTQH